MRLCLDRTVARRRERSVQLALPPIRNAVDSVGAIGEVANAVGRSDIAPARRSRCPGSSKLFVRAIDASDFETRLRLLKEREAAQRQNALWRR